MARREPVPHDGRPTVLVVDDEPDILDTLLAYLSEHLDADVEGLDGGAAAKERIREGHVDLLLTDFRMPDVDGLELVRWSRETIPDLGTMMITAYPDTDLAISAINEGHIMHFFVKPPEPQQLVAVVKQYLDDLHRTNDRQAAFSRALAMGRRALQKGSEA